METTLKELDVRNTVGLFNLINEDGELKSELGFKNGFLLADFEKSNKEWATKNNAKLFSIVADGVVVGMISLSHIDGTKQEACTGYFVGNKYRNRGYATKAFEIIVNEASRLGLKFLHSTINKDNAASLAVWQKYLHLVEEKGENFYLTLNLENL